MLPLVKWSPMREISSLHREMDELFNRFFGRSERWSPVTGIMEGMTTPAVDYSLMGDKLSINVELPGIDPKDVEISVAGNLLTIKGERRQEKEFKEEDYYVHEIGMGRFERTLTLPEGVNTDKIKANYSKGILQITMPAEAVKKARRIDIESTEQPKKLKAA